MTVDLTLKAIEDKLARLYDGNAPADVASQLTTLVIATGDAVDRLPVADVSRLAITDQLTFASQALAEHNPEAARRHILEAIRRARRRAMSHG